MKNDRRENEMVEKECISVILPIYNVKNYLKDCIESIRGQTYSNLEIILVDDGSTDGSSDVCDDYLRIDSRIKVIHKDNGGLSDARNAGIEVSTGAYIALVDSDDVVAPNFIENLYKCCISTDSCMAVCPFIKFTDRNNICVQDSTEGSISIVTGEEIIQRIYQGMAGKYGFVAWNKLYHRDLFDDIRYPVGRIYEDTFTTYKLFLKAKKIVLIEDQLYFYRIRPGSIMSQKYDLKKIKDGIDADSSVVEYLYNYKYMELLAYASSYFCKQSIATYYKDLKMLENKEKREAKQYVKSVYKCTWKYCKESNMGCIKKIIYGLFSFF